MKISKLFHWLYALLMFLPLILFLMAFLGDFSALWSSNGVFNASKYFEALNTTLTAQLSSQYLGLYGIFSYIVEYMFGYTSGLYISIELLLSYWAFISITWLVFDLVMYLPLLVHRWLDKGVLQ